MPSLKKVLEINSKIRTIYFGSNWSINILENKTTSPNEIHFVDHNGDVVGKIVNTSLKGPERPNIVTKNIDDYKPE